MPLGIKTGRKPFTFYWQSAVQLADPFSAIFSTTWGTPVGEGRWSPGEEERLGGDWRQDSLEPQLLVL